MHIPRQTFEKLCDPLLEKAITKMRSAVNFAKPEVDITDVVLFGGATRMPKVAETVKDTFPNFKVVNNDNVD